jgi:3-hydroxyisobutyrate dehydrogenase-like beta-hydroxyacid dehydrogenase
MGARIGVAACGEVMWASEGRSGATARRAALGGFRDVGTLPELVAASEVILSLCPPAIAEDVASAVGAAGFRGLFVEANAIAPARCERIAAVLSDHGGRVVDGAVIGSNSLNLYLSGDPDDVAVAAELFADSEVNTLRLEGGVGAASALKMAFGGWNKIGIALTAQAYAIARAYGVEDALAREGVESDRLVRAGQKAWRWSPEMDEVAATCESLGLPDGIAHGAAAVFVRWSDHRDKPARLDELLNDLGQRPARQPVARFRHKKTRCPALPGRWAPALYDDALVPDPEGIITGGHDNKAARMISFYEGDRIKARPLTTMLRRIIANNRSGSARKRRSPISRDDDDT